MKYLKSFFIVSFLIIFIGFFNFVYSTNNTSSQQVNNQVVNESSIIKSVTTNLSTSESSALSINEVLNIVLISIGGIIILFSLAILNKLKK